MHLDQWCDQVISIWLTKANGHFLRWTAKLDPIVSRRFQMCFVQILKAEKAVRVVAPGKPVLCKTRCLSWSVQISGRLDVYRPKYTKSGDQ